MGEKQQALMQYVLSLTPEQVEKVIKRLPEIRAAISEEEKAAS